MRRKVKSRKRYFQCRKCSVCGNFGRNKKSMITKGSNFKEMKLKQKLNCKYYGIYCATCIQCTENYIGQTVTRALQKDGTHTEQLGKIMLKVKIDLK